MPHILQNDYLQIEIDLPHEGYRSSRFDWAGKIRQITYKGLPFTTTEVQQGFDSKQHGCGLYNEWDIDGPQGFANCPIGSSFHKIGIGAIRKTDEVYDFSEPYSIDQAKFDYIVKENHITINCYSVVLRGQAYQLIKDIRINENTIIISYQLHNLGTQPLHTTEYVHNFIAINNDRIGKSYELVLPSGVAPDSFDETVNPDDCVKIEDSTISFNKAPTRPFFFGDLLGGVTAPAHWHLYHRPSKMHITETGDFRAYRVNLWGTSHVISPELFHRIEIPSNEVAIWSRTYKIWQ